jgi:hypothetical protein
MPPAPAYCPAQARRQATHPLPLARALFARSRARRPPHRARRTHRARARAPRARRRRAPPGAGGTAGGPVTAAPGQHRWGYLRRGASALKAAGFDGARAPEILRLEMGDWRAGGSGCSLAGLCSCLPLLSPRHLGSCLVFQVHCSSDDRRRRRGKDDCRPRPPSVRPRVGPGPASQVSRLPYSASGCTAGPGLGGM